MSTVPSIVGGAGVVPGKAVDVSTYPASREKIVPTRSDDVAVNDDEERASDDEDRVIVTGYDAAQFCCLCEMTSSPHELGLDCFGNPVVNPYIADRLRNSNEAAVLQFVAKHTTIPVPEFLDLWEENELVNSKTALVENGVELRQVDDSLLSTAIMSV
ncbi:hypothetical protein E4U14_005240 [Claviceps sp. LM454 group G7]|nr:hypothetical protein E4U14_005240 [Claviceps sp. LM454 group G7]